MRAPIFMVGAKVQALLAITKSGKKDLRTQVALAKMSAMETESQVAKRVIEHFGGPGKTADAFEVSTEAIRLWRKKGIPLDRSLEVEERTDGAVKAEDILAEARKS